MEEWMPGVERIETAATDGGAFDPIAAMSHTMVGRQRTMIAWAHERPWITPASAHFTIGVGGRTAQHVPITRRAWHAGRSDAPGGGWSEVGFTDVTHPSWRLWRPGHSPNELAVGIEHEDEGDPGRSVWPEAQIEASINVHRWIFEQLAIAASLDTVVSHGMTSPRSRAHDPGPGWPQARIIDELTAPLVTPLRLHYGRTPQGQSDYEVDALNAFFGIGWQASVEHDDDEERVIWRRPR